MFFLSLFLFQMLSEMIDYIHIRITLIHPILNLL